MADDDLKTFDGQQAKSRRSIADVEDRLNVALGQAEMKVNDAVEAVGAAELTLRLEQAKRDALREALRLVQEKP